MAELGTSPKLRPSASFPGLGNVPQACEAAFDAATPLSFRCPDDTADLDGRLPSLPVLKVVSKPLFFSGLDERDELRAGGGGGTESDGRGESWWELELRERAVLGDRGESVVELFFDVMTGRCGKGGPGCDRSGYTTAGMVP